MCLKKSSQSSLSVAFMCADVGLSVGVQEASQGLLPPLEAVFPCPAATTAIISQFGVRTQEHQQPTLGIWLV